MRSFRSRNRRPARFLQGSSFRVRERSHSHDRTVRHKPAASLSCSSAAGPFRGRRQPKLKVAMPEILEGTLTRNLTQQHWAQHRQPSLENEWKDIENSRCWMNGGGSGTDRSWADPACQRLRPDSPVFGPWVANPRSWPRCATAQPSIIKGP